MICPVCKNSRRVEIDTHSDGYVENLQECGACGALWTHKGDRDVVIHGATRQKAVGA